VELVTSLVIIGVWVVAAGITLLAGFAVLRVLRRDQRERIDGELHDK
jgi:hypothetical protein